MIKTILCWKHSSANICRQITVVCFFDLPSWQIVGHLSFPKTNQTPIQFSFKISKIISSQSKIFVAGNLNCRKRSVSSSAPSCLSSPQVKYPRIFFYHLLSARRVSLSWKEACSPISFCSRWSFKSFHSCRGISWGHHDLFSILQRGRKYMIGIWRR